MLMQLHISQFAIVEQLDLDFQSGLTVITGETGAGKSILIDALSLVLGDRADATAIKAPAERAEISAAFSIPAHSIATQWLEERDFLPENNSVLRRIITRDGRSKAYINGSPCTLQDLRSLGELLIDIHGQHEHQSLLKKASQRELLDHYAQHTDLVLAVRNAYQAWKDCQNEIESLARQDSQDARIELLQFQLQELKALDVKQGEYETLEIEHKRLAHLGKITQYCQEALDILKNNEVNNVMDLIHAVQQRIQAISELDSALKPTQEIVDALAIQANEVNDRLDQYMDHLDMHPERYEELEQRLSAIFQIARKHKVSPQDLAACLPQLQTELDALEHRNEHLLQLQKQSEQLANRYRNHSKTLTASRQKAALQLNQAVTQQLQSLGMLGSSLAIALQPCDIQHFSMHGMEDIEFLVCTNPGQPLQPLTKIASGGELSRISLSIQVVTVQTTQISTLVFDEVDVGIGGAVAEVVGRLLRQLAERGQVLCVTHLAQVAAQGHHHLQVEKISAQQSTNTKINILSKSEKVQEIARMLGGITVTRQTLKHAKEMVELIP